MDTDHPTTVLRKCFEILEKIRREYPEGNFDREMLHGEMDFRYKQIHELRRSLDAMPETVRRFALCVQALPVNREIVVKLLRWLRDHPGSFSAASANGFQAVRDRAVETARTLGIQASDLLQVLARLRLTGVLTKDYELSEIYRPVAAAFLDLSASRTQEAD